MDLRLGTKIFWFVQNPKKVSHLPSTVTVTRGTFFKEATKLSQHATFGDFRITFDCLSFRRCRRTSFREKKFYGYCIFLYGNLPMTPAYSTDTHSYVISFCLRLMWLKAYLDCLYEKNVWVPVLNHEDKLVQTNFACKISSNTNSKLSF